MAVGSITTAKSVLFRCPDRKHGLFSGCALNFPRSENMSQNNALTGSEKKPYAQPRLITHGSVEKLTQHSDHSEHDHHDEHGDRGRGRGCPGSNLWSSR